MINEIEIKRRKIRWWFNVASSGVVVLFGLALLALRYLLHKNPVGQQFWPLIGLVLGYGVIRLAFHLWRKGHLYDDLEEEETMSNGQ
ncbi:hypothetical protein HY768_06090 [candidate division TA06 bacterium]|uniref:Uncharacterized protein n=1 Tax=candidate division TA06 bacterium TaxID=2250710 RepID=A0A933IB88_UNCT6|nr:hypothetical protein [candidate division TA06 bacterium]